MPSYFDLLAFSDIEIQENTVLYLIRLNANSEHPEENHYAIKGITCSSEDFKKFRVDPYTSLNEYWLIDTKKLLDSIKQEEYKEMTSIVFPDNKLLTGPLTHDFVIKCFGINPITSAPLQFNSVREMPVQLVALPQLQNQHTFFAIAQPASTELFEATRERRHEYSMEELIHRISR